jgi:hypothetical protein
MSATLDAFGHAPTAPVLTRTLPMRQQSPLAKTLESETHTDVVFPGERISRLADFVRLRVAAQKITFLAVLASEGLTPSYYAAMVARFDEARRHDPNLNHAFLTRFAHAMTR